MGFEEFLPADDKEENQEDEIELKDAIEEERIEKIGHNQVYDIITDKKADWQALIYDLINSEQLDPWDIDICLLSNKYFEKVREMEEINFYISSKVLLALALLLRIKSEFLLNRHIRSIDEILFGKKEGPKSVFERIEINEDDLPLLIPKTPLPRQRKVSLDELMNALNKAINTESRRIKKEVQFKRAHQLSKVDIPEFAKVSLKDRVRQFYAGILTAIKKKEPEKINKVSYTHFTKNQREQKLAYFLPLLHLSNTKKLWLEQTEHLGEIWIYLYTYFEKNKENFLQDLEKDVEEMEQELNSEKAENIEDELKEEIDKVSKEIKIEEATGFEDEQ